MKLIIPDITSKDFRALLTSAGEGEDSAILALRGYITPERMTQVALAAIRSTPGLLQCGVDSFLEALTLCMEAGLAPDGRSAHLIPRGSQVGVLFDWKGLVALGRRAGVEAIHADVVCEHDHFAAGHDGGARLTHEIDYRSPRGEPYAAYCYFILDGEPGIEVMTREEIESERAALIAFLGPAVAEFWERDWPAMAKREVIARAMQRWPVEFPGSAPREAEVTAPQPGEPSAASYKSAGANGSGIGHGSDAPPCAGEPHDDTKPTSLGKLRRFMQARDISEASMLDYLKEEGRIAEFITTLADVPAPVIDDVVTSWVEMTEEMEF